MTKEEIELFKEKCPKCGTPWSTVPRIVHGGHWVHCVPCGKKAEQIIKEAKESKSTGSSYGNVDWGHNKGWGGL